MSVVVDALELPLATDAVIASELPIERPRAVAAGVRSTQIVEWPAVVEVIQIPRLIAADRHPTPRAFHDPRRDAASDSRTHLAMTMPVAQKVVSALRHLAERTP